MPDEEAVARTGHPLSGVIQRRRTLHVRLPRPGHRPWTSEEDKLLGTIKDLDLAQHLGRRVGAVRARRERLKIPAPKPE